MRYLYLSFLIVLLNAGLAQAVEDGIYVKASYGVPWMVMFLIFFLILTPLLVAVLVSWIKKRNQNEE